MSCYEVFMFSSSVVIEGEHVEPFFSALKNIVWFKK